MNSTNETVNEESSYKEKKAKTFKIIVIGDSNVGKTCLTFSGGHFPTRPESTIGVDFRERKVTIKGEEITTDSDHYTSLLSRIPTNLAQRLADQHNMPLQLWDTAGQERFRKSMVQHYYRNVQAVVFVYDVTNFASFENISSWINECNRYNLSYNIPRILVGNKCDCKDQLRVPTNLAQRLADQHNMPHISLYFILQLFETSAKNDSDCSHIDSIFLTLAHKLKASKPMMPFDPINFPPADLRRADVESVERNSEPGCCF
ncbi:Ras-related protein Rab-33B [Armadillidium nasatum]|uniref:Ras-related protein Rab-33B n=1 Tax=Armadillidium nasatum TaxID=96803 RepID=A0A5N5TD90_9CRUS|nr:Ras-related protein Rab-33B [Armadillidium nasatum]